MMNPYVRGAAQYKNTQVRSSTPLELVVLLYDGAIGAMAEARDAMARKDIPARRAAIGRAQAIVAELQATLDMDGGGAIAIELDKLYTWVITRLTDAIVKQDPKPIEEARKIFETLAEGWRTIATAPAPAATAGTRP